MDNQGSSSATLGQIQGVNQNLGTLVQANNSLVTAANSQATNTANQVTQATNLVTQTTYLVTATNNLVTQTTNLVTAFNNLSTSINNALSMGSWLTWSPTVAASSGTITTIGAVTARYQTMGKTVFVSLSIAITTNGTGASTITVTLPNTANSVGMIAGRISGGSSQAITGAVSASSNSLVVRNYDGTYPGANGITLLLCGTYEAQ